MNDIKLRDYFAAEAMNAFCMPLVTKLNAKNRNEIFALLAKRAYEAADALLEARKISH